MYQKDLYVFADKDLSW